MSETEDRGVWHKEKWRTGSAAAWWRDAQRRLSATSASRVEIAIKKELVMDSIRGWDEDFKGAEVPGEVEACHRARVAVCAFAKEHGWELEEDLAYSQVFVRPKAGYT